MELSVVLIAVLLVAGAWTLFEFVLCLLAARARPSPRATCPGTRPRADSSAGDGTASDSALPDLRYGARECAGIESHARFAPIVVLPVSHGRVRPT
jgi:hypothetical protein